MRPASLAELGLMARVLTPLPTSDRPLAARQILAEVEVAAAHLRATGRCHPAFGDGSLMARCLTLSPIAEPLAEDAAFLEALTIACWALADHSET